MKVLMLPHISQFGSEESGIRRVVENYFKYLPQFGVELVAPDTDSYDLKAVHAGMSGGDACVAHLHGIYFTADYPNSSHWEWKANANVIDALRHAKEVTVPSEWVAHNIARDMRFKPHVIPHGIDWQDWQHNHDNEGFVLWTKNRVGDVCDPLPMNALAENFPSVRFVSTFGTNTPNVTVLDGIVPHHEMKILVQKAGVYLSTTKETFGLGVLEALAAGTPVLGWDYGGNSVLVEHGKTGYLAQPENYEDLAQGLDYCFKHRKALGANSREMAKNWTWEKACSIVYGVYKLAMKSDNRPMRIEASLYEE